MQPEHSRDLIFRHFDLEGLKALCAQLHVDYENLGGDNTRRAKSHALTMYLSKRGRLLELFEAIDRERPQVVIAPCFHELIAEQFNSAGRIEHLFAALGLTLRNFQERERYPWDSAAWLSDKAKKLQAYYYEREEWSRLLHMVASQSPRPIDQDTIARLFSVQHSPPTSPPSLHHETKRKVLDAAIRQEIELGKATYLLVLVRDSGSDGLVALLKIEPDYLMQEDDVKTSRIFTLRYPVDNSGNLLPAPVKIVVTAPDFEPPTQSIYTEIEPPIQPNGQPEPIPFMLMPLAVGELQLMVEVYQVMGNDEPKQIGTKPISTISKNNPSPLTHYRVISLIFKSISLSPQQFTTAGMTYIEKQTDDSDQALGIYRRILLDDSGHLPLREMDVGAAAPSQERSLGLPQVYVHLATTTQIADEQAKEKDPVRQAKTRPLTALEAVAANRKLVLLGEPGGGKSTFVQHLAHCLAAHTLAPDAGWQERLPDWPAGEADLLPIPVILRDFARSLSPPLSEANASHLWQFIEARLASQNLTFAALHLQQALEDGRAILLLDGLDELPTTDQRRFVRDVLQHFVSRYPGNRYLITCRILSYQPALEGEPDLRLPAHQFPQFELAPFDEERIDHFVQVWYAELTRIGSVRPEDRAGLTDRLKQAVRRPGLWELANNPLLLTVIALVHAHKGRLPEARALLYEETVEMLLWRWEEVKIGQGQAAPRLRQLLLDAERSDLDLKRLLWRLAYEAHMEGGSQEQVADIAELDLRRELAALCREVDWNWADQVLRAMKLRAGLLVERRPGVFSFPHRTFQEYLAGAHLATQSRFAERAAELVAQGAFWREVILLAAGRLVYLSGELDRPLTLVQRLLLGGESELDCRKVWLAGDILREAGQQRVSEDGWGRELLGQVRERLSQLVAGGHLSPRERAEAGDTLAALSDRRPGVGTVRVSGVVLPDVALHYIPPGTFWLGAAEDDPDADERERPMAQFDIPYGYWLTRYPVTVAQFGAFVANSGYRPRFGNRWRGVANRPVVGIIWDDALAFCRWLEKQWREQGWLPSGYSVILPSEAEWEKGSRGGLKIPTAPMIYTPGPALADVLAQQATLTANPQPQRRYPWGDEWQTQRANSKETGLGTTCVTGAYPTGISPYGLLDMSGNVWEWTRSRWGTSYSKPDYSYPYQPDDGREQLDSGGSRVVRGGAWRSDPHALRCACRTWGDPYGTSEGGFRVSVSPFPYATSSPWLL